MARKTISTPNQRALILCGGQGAKAAAKEFLDPLAAEGATPGSQEEVRTPGNFGYLVRSEEIDFYVT